MKATSPLEVMQVLLQDCASNSTINFGADLIYIESRLKHEGLSFLTITLPEFCSEFFRALELGSVDSSSFPGWRKTKCLPSFLKGFTSRVFNIRSGELYDDPDVQAIKSIRQICLVFKKINLPCSEERIAKALRDFVTIDNDLRGFAPTSRNLDMFGSVSRIVVSSLFPSKIDVSDLIPKHGPGSTQELVLGNKKFDPSNYPIYQRLEKTFPIGETFFNTEESYYNSDCSIETNGKSPVVRVVDVPKTLKAPRIIALEPVAMQYLQQAIKELLVTTIESHPLTLGHVNFTDQSINQDLALLNSITRTLATLDLSSASDRVARKLVRIMLKVNPSLAHLVFLTRSPKAEVNGKLIKLRKFASMGSALCFPVEALAFFILCITNRLLMQGFSAKHLSYSDVFKASRDVYVYGDDILIPVDEVEAACDLFEDFKLKVSTTKSFWKGGFRESCGMDAYGGIDITPIYIRQMFPSSKKNAKSIISTVETANQFYSKGFINTFKTLQVCVENILGTLPSIDDRSPGIGWLAPGRVGRLRYNSERQDFDVKTYVPTTKSISDKIDGYPALHKCLLMKALAKERKLRQTGYFLSRSDILEWLESHTVTDTMHLEETSMRRALLLKTRWVPWI